MCKKIWENIVKMKHDQVIIKKTASNSGYKKYYSEIKYTADLNSIEKLGYNNKLVSWKNNEGIQQEHKKGKDGKYRRDGR